MPGWTPGGDRFFYPRTIANAKPPESADAIIYNRRVACPMGPGDYCAQLHPLRSWGRFPLFFSQCQLHTWPSSCHSSPEASSILERASCYLKPTRRIRRFNHWHSPWEASFSSSWFRAFSTSDSRAQCAAEAEGRRNRRHASKSNSLVDPGQASSGQCSAGAE
jgi:hypothetical protein